MVETVYRTKWTLDLLLERFYTSRHYLEHEYGESTFDECYEQVQKINKKIARKSYKDINLDDLKEYIDITPEICKSCHYWYRWGIEYVQNDFDEIDKQISKSAELLDLIEPYFEKKNYTGCPNLSWNFFMSAFWGGLACDMYEEVITQAERLYKFFENTQEIRKIKWVPFAEMNDPMSNFDINWSRHHLGLCLLLGKAYYLTEQYDLSAEAYRKAINAHYDSELLNKGVKRIFYHMGVNRILEAATELYCLEQTQENRDQVLKLFSDCVKLPTDSTFEAVLETLLINYMVYENVFGVRVL